MNTGISDALSQLDKHEIRIIIDNILGKRIKSEDDSLGFFSVLLGYPVFVVVFYNYFSLGWLYAMTKAFWFWLPLTAIIFIYYQFKNNRGKEQALNDIKKIFTDDERYKYTLGILNEYANNQGSLEGLYAREILDAPGMEMPFLISSPEEQVEAGFQQQDKENNQTGNNSRSHNPVKVTDKPDQVSMDQKKYIPLEPEIDGGNS